MKSSKLITSLMFGALVSIAMLAMAVPAEAAKRAAGTAELINCWSSPERNTASSISLWAAVGNSPLITKYAASAKFSRSISVSAG